MQQARKFGFWTLTFLVVANMIGAGVFTTSGFSLNDLKSPHLVVLAWGVGGVIAIAGAISYGQLVRHMPESGGEYLFLSRAAHPLFGCIAGWVSLTAGFTGPIAYSAMTFEKYAMPLVNRPSWYRDDMLAVAIIVFCFLWHFIVPAIGEIGQNAVVVLKLLLLAVFIGAALKLSPDRWQGISTMPAGTEIGSWATAYAFAGSLVWISLSYAGFNAGVYVADEVDNPQLIAKALFAGTVSVVLLYVALNAIFVYSAPTDSIAAQPDIAAVVADWIGGQRLATFVRITIAIALFTSVSSMMLAAPRVYAKMADDGVMPKWFAFSHGRPRAAMLAQAILAIVVVLWSDLYNLLQYLSLTLMLSAVGTVACLFTPFVRSREPSKIRLVAPAVFIIASLVSAVLRSINEPQLLIGTAATFAIGVAGYFAVTDYRRVD
ncbi:MAG: amino acid permease [Planctomycetales bacterium]|nr:amino acid permease [Planctomycetales bacterium]